MKRKQILKMNMLALIGGSLVAFAHHAQADVPAQPPSVPPTLARPLPARSPSALPVALPVAAPAVISVVPVQVVYVAENQPVQIVDSQGHLIEVLYLKKKP